MTNGNPTDDWNFGGSVDNTEPHSDSSENWIDWDNAQEQQVQDDWGTPPPQMNFNAQAPQGDAFQDFNNTDYNAQSNNTNTGTRSFNFGKKVVAIIIAGVLVVIALGLNFIDGISVKKVKPKPNTTTQQSGTAPSQQSSQTQQSQQGTQAQQNQQTQQNTQSQQNQQVPAQTANNNLNLLKVPQDKTITHSGVVTTNGTILEKERYLVNNQVLYSLKVNMLFNTSSVAVNCFCNYDAFSSIQVGDLVSIDYTVGDNNFISINSIKK